VKNSISTKTEKKRSCFVNAGLLKIGEFKRIFKSPMCLKIKPIKNNRDLSIHRFMVLTDLS
jgi:hypothetical protein